MFTKRVLQVEQWEPELLLLIVEEYLNFLNISCKVNCFFHFNSFFCEISCILYTNILFYSEIKLLFHSLNELLFYTNVFVNWKMLFFPCAISTPVSTLLWGCITIWSILLWPAEKPECNYMQLNLYLAF